MDSIIHRYVFVSMKFVPYGAEASGMYVEEKLSSKNISEVVVPISQHFITKVANPILISVTALAIRVSDLYQAHRLLPRLITNIITIDRLIATKNDENSKWILALTVLLILISWPFQIYSNLSRDKISMFMWMLLLNVYNNFSSTCCEFQFISICWMLRSRYNCVNEELRQLKLTRNNIDAGDELLELTVCKQIENVDLRRHNFNDGTTTRIARIRKAHRLLSESCLQLNIMYTFQILMSLGSCTINVLLNLYFAIFGGFGRPATTKYDSQSLSDIIQAVVWSLYYFARFTLVCTVTGRLVDTANSTKTIICQKMNRSLEKTAKQELWMFFAYTTAHEIQFTACGFFKIDIALITAAVATGTTYLVILAQFHKQ